MKYGTPLRTCLNSAQRAHRKDKINSMLANVGYVLGSFAAFYGFLLVAFPA